MAPKTQASTEHPHSPASASSRARAAALARHRRKCVICYHPALDEIEAEFIRWANPHDIVNDYQLPSRSALYRHAEATGLLARRRRNLRGISERILECVTNASPSASSILRAMRIFAHITEDGQWIEPVKHAVVTHVHSVADPDAGRAEAPATSAQSSQETFHQEPREEIHDEYVPRARRASSRNYRPAPARAQSDLDAFAARASSRGKPAPAAQIHPAAPPASPAGHDNGTAIPPRDGNASRLKIPPEMETVLRQTVATATARLENRAVASNPSTTSPLPASPNKSAPEFLIGTPNALNGCAND